MRARHRGIALVTTILVLPILVVLGFCLTVTGIHNLNITQAGGHSKRAAYVAEAGAARGVANLKADSNFSGTFTYQMQALPDTANVTVLNNNSGAQTVQAANGADVPPGFAYILSQSRTVGSPRSPRTTGVLLKVSPANPFRYAEFGNISVSLAGGAKTDSFNSAIGPYASSHTSSGGDIGTNGVGSGDVNLIGNPTVVQGNVAVGPSGTSSVVTGAGSYTGAFSALTSPYPMSPVTIPSGLTSGPPASVAGNRNAAITAGYYGDIKMLAGKTLTLAAGTYVFDSLTLVGQARLVTTGNVLIYVTGKNGSTLDLAGGAVANSSGLAQNLTFMVAGSSVVKVTGGAQTYMAVYAPRATIDVGGGGELFGSLIGNRIDNHGGTFVHYDQNLASLGGAPAAVTSWQRF